VQLIDLLLPVVDYLPQVDQLTLRLLQHGVQVEQRLLAHLVHLLVKRVVVSGETLAVLPLHLGYEVVLPVRFVQLEPDLVGIGFYLGNRVEDLWQRQIYDPVGVWT
jgi:hypothetical protein